MRSKNVVFASLHRSITGMPEQWRYVPTPQDILDFPRCPYAIMGLLDTDRRKTDRLQGTPRRASPRRKDRIIPVAHGYFGQQGTSLSCPRARRDTSQRSYRVRAASIAAKYSRATGIWCCIAPHGRGTDSNFTRCLTGDHHQRPLQETLAATSGNPEQFEGVVLNLLFNALKRRR